MKVLKVGTCEINDENVYIGRTSIYGNPFVMNHESERNYVCYKFEKWIYSPDQSDLLDTIKKNLKGKNLVCHCAPKKCHGDTILKIANEI